MTGKRSTHHIFALAVVSSATILIVGACKPRVEVFPSDDVAFAVDLERVGPIYENSDLGVKYQPPVNWDRLEGNQRQAVLDALASSDDEGDYSLDVADIFFDTESMSFSSIAMVSEGDAIPAVEEYAESFAAILGLNDRDAINDDHAVVARMNFSVNDVPIVQFRHLRSNRITFTLLFSSKTEKLIQLDYSIPADTYQREAGKLESSIGTLQLISVD